MTKKQTKKNKTAANTLAIPKEILGKKSKQAATKKQLHAKSFLSENWKQLAVIFCLALALYIDSASFDYVLDDNILIVNNKFTQQGFKGIRDIFEHESFTGYFGEQQEMVEGGRYRPLSIATFAAEKSITGGNKMISHLTNILLYALTGILIYRVLLFMFPPSRGTTKVSKWFFTIPFVTAIFFIAHPLHVEVVANVKGRDELFALLGELGALYFTFMYIENKKNVNLAFSFICFFFGLLSKESVITFLLIIPMTTYFFSTTSVSDKIKITVPLILGVFVYLLIRYNVLGYFLPQDEITNVMNNPFYGMSFNEKTATVFYTLLLYLKLLVFPHPLTHDYYPYQIPVMKWSDWQPILSLLLYALLIWIAFKGFRKKMVLSYCIFFFLIALSIVSNVFISVGTFMGDRFVYQASLGFCLAAAWFLVTTLNSTMLLKRISLAVFVAALLAFAIIIFGRLPDWKTEERLDRSAVRLSPNSASANFYYGLSLWNNAYMKLPKDASSSRRMAVLDSVRPYFEKAARIVPTYSYANSFTAAVAAEQHKLDHNYEKLIKAFEQVNRTGAYEVLILGYLKQINSTVSNLKDANLLAAFYERMIQFYQVNFAATTLPSDYRSLLQEIRARSLHLN